jgi:hypothetical protein
MFSTVLGAILKLLRALHIHHNIVPGLHDWDIIPSGLHKWGIIMPGFNVTSQTDVANIRDLLRKLSPQNCKKNLIRLGGVGDGGYLVPDDLDGIEYCFSPGVSTISDFENQLADRGIKSFLADYSVDAPSVLRPELTFDKKYLGTINNKQFFTLAAWKEKYLSGYDKDLILQMDIEGAEYEVIFNTSDELLDQFRIIVIEFHFLQMLADPFAFKLLSSCFEKLLQSFCVVHIHPNNCGNVVKVKNITIPMSMEFTFLNKKRINSKFPVQSLPNKLDVPNDSRKKDIILPRCWYSGV